ncbi:hypothetical protein [Euzebya sp.]|uniref:hypothetical protein n=1 Tax=Euzebya sp. TaxID=1971409 RepID=UPI003512BD1A
MEPDHLSADPAVLHALEPEDTPAEVVAAFRTLRRVAVAYMLLFLVVVVTVPLLNGLAGWWTRGELVGGVSPAFAAAVVGLYAAIIAIGMLSARVADQVERRMLGGRELLDTDVDDEVAGP